MAFARRLKSKPIIEVTVDQPKQSVSTEIVVNDNFKIDLDELSYKKAKDTTNEPTTDRQTKSKETNYLEEIDDGPKRLTSRSDFKSTSSIDVLENQPDNSVLIPDDSQVTSDKIAVKDDKAVSKTIVETEKSDTYMTSGKIEGKDEKNASKTIVEAEENDTYVYDQSSEILHIKESNGKSSNDSRTDKSSRTKAKNKSEDKRVKKGENKSKPIKSQTKGMEENSATLEMNILYKKEVSEIRRSVYKTNDAGNGIEIILPSYLLDDDSRFESVVWAPDERGLFLKENNFTHQQRFRTDIFHIYKKGPNKLQKPKGNPKSLFYPDIDPSNITVKVHIPELSQMNGLCLHFRAHIRFRKQWTIIETSYLHKLVMISYNRNQMCQSPAVLYLREGVITFNCNQMESFCIVSTPRDDKHIVTPDGYEYVSDADNRIKVDFPAGAVSQDEKVEFKVIPINRESMATKIESNPRNCFILAISECLAVRHTVSSFEKPINIQLPVDDLPGIDTTNVDCKYGVFKRKHKGSFWLTNLVVEERNGIPTISVNTFSEYVIIKVKSEMFGKLQSLLPEEIEIAIGDKMCCKILFFVGNRKPNSISVLLECVTKDSMEDVSQRRRSMGYELVRQCPSPDFFFPVNQRIRVDVGGRFALTKHIGKGYYFLTFFPIAADNFICFPVDRYTGMESAVYGIISFKEDNGTKKDLHAIHYDPWSSKGKPQGKHNVSRSAPVSRQMTAASDVRKEKLDDNFDELFFSDKGLLSVAQLLSPDAMFKVVINLDMTKPQYEQITNDYSALTTSSRHLQLLKTALEISSCESKIQRFLSALRDSDENRLAEKVEELYFEKMRLSRDNLERKPTVVTIKNTESSVKQ